MTTERNRVADYYEIEKGAIEKNKVAHYFKIKQEMENTNSDLLDIRFFIKK